MQRNVFETIMGAVVIAVAVSFMYIAYKSGSVGVTPSGGYELFAKFDRADGLALGTDVRISGIKVGTVSKQMIDPETYQAVVTFNINSKLGIPEDSNAEIVGDGLLGSKYVAVVPGGSDTMLKGGEQIKYTQSSISLEQLLGKFIFGSSDEEEDVSDPFGDTSALPTDGNGNKSPENELFSGI